MNAVTLENLFLQIKGMFETQQTRLLTTLDETHEKYCHAEELDWPSLYFHLRSLESGRALDVEKFAEHAYAMLVAWKMQRTGGGARMSRFEEFKSSLESIWSIAVELQKKTPDALDVTDWTNLKIVFSGLQCMELPPKLVGHSKVMAHLLPSLVPPVDGGPTLKFLHANVMPPSGIEDGWAKLEEMLKEFFYPILKSPPFPAKADEWLAKRDRFRWDTSPLKIVDNLVWELAESPKG